MSKISLTPDDSGTGTFTLASPDSNTNHTLTLPDATGELLTTTGDGSGLTGIVIPPVFQPTTVTGTTPSLNVGSFNYFDNGSLTADTTVSFASVPTDAKWRYSSLVDTAASDAFDISTSTFLRSFSVATEDTNPRGVFFKPDGTKMYVTGGTGQDVNEYDLSTAWNVSSALFLQNFSVATEDTVPLGLFFKPDGTKMYVLGAQGDGVDEYNLSTAWDVSSASFLQNFSVTGQDTQPSSVFFKPDGTKMYVSGNAGNDINEYNLSTAWNVSTASYLRVFSVSTQDSTPQCIFFKSDGLKMYLLGYDGDAVYEYNLSTAWDVSSASFLQSFSVATEDTVVGQGLFFKPDGTKMYVTGAVGDSVYEYSVGIPPTITLPSSVAGNFSALTLGKRVTYEFVTLDGGTTVTLISEEVITT